MTRIEVLTLKSGALILVMLGCFGAGIASLAGDLYTGDLTVSNRMEQVAITTTNSYAGMLLVSPQGDIPMGSHTNGATP